MLDLKDLPPMMGHGRHVSRPLNVPGGKCGLHGGIDLPLGTALQLHGGKTTQEPTGEREDCQVHGDFTDENGWNCKAVERFFIAEIHGTVSHYFFTRGGLD
jgi:hypothetical protein